ncbi:hypothetical protein CIW48_07750 [Methylobacterium sp. P1-11]|uniref:hypothetical protein n=1 Tax=Methylobacterium sp. P1-11 TaxID=2024616 RepID=UPI0011F089C1|nr:hypothetical protein [Methylobacterium sp. P1-11]KAA0124641.1 hypothetical protein CIW48_07750 [Methylobacterium sp. P1-11]
MARDGNRPHPSALARYPVPIELISALFRADDAERDRLLAPMPAYGRARIAAYCADHARLEAVGLKVARSCDEATLVKAAGPALGADLFARSRAGAPAQIQRQAA